MPLEKNLETACKRIADKEGAVWLKIERRKGWPDRILMVRGLYCWCELKTARGKLSPMQVYVHNLLRYAGARVTVVRSAARLKRLIQGMIRE